MLHILQEQLNLEQDLTTKHTVDLTYEHPINSYVEETVCSTKKLKHHMRWIYFSAHLLD